MPAPKDPQKREAWLKAISRKGDTPWNKGKTTPDDVKQKQSEARNKFLQTKEGKEFLEQQAKQASRHHKGKTLTAEHKQRISSSNFGVTRGSGHYVSDATKQKISQALKEWYTTDEGKQHRLNASLMATEQMQNCEIGMFGYGKFGYHDSPKAGRVHYRSSWELAVYQQLDANDDVLNYVVEPFAIPYLFEDVERSYLPDILITFKDLQQLLVEIKPSHKLDDPQNQAKFAAALAIYGDNFEIWSEDDVFAITFSP